MKKKTKIVTNPEFFWALYSEFEGYLISALEAQVTVKWNNLDITGESDMRPPHDLHVPPEMWFEFLSDFLSSESNRKAVSQLCLDGRRSIMGLELVDDMNGNRYLSWRIK